MRTLALLLALTVSASGQMLQSIVNAKALGLGAGTFTVVQTPAHTACATATTCAVTLTSTTAVGNVLAFTGITGSGVKLLSSNKGGTLVVPTSCNGGRSGSGSNYYAFCGYILPSGSSAATTPITLTFSGSTNGAWVKFWELHPSANGSNVGLDTANTVSQLSTASPVTPASIWSGTNDAEVQGAMATSGSTVTALAAPYSNTEFAATFFGYGSAPTPANGNSVAWTLNASDNTLATAMAFGFNTTACADQSLIDFEAGTNNTVMTASALASSMHGWQGGYWSQQGTAAIKFLSAANMPLANATGRLCGDGSSTASGLGSMGGGITWSGTDGNDFIQYQWGDTVNSPFGTAALPNVSMGMWWFGDQPAAGGTNDNIDAFTIHAVTDFAGVNYYAAGGNRVVRLESTEGNGADVTVPASTWLWIGLVYQAGGTASVTVYDCVSGSAPSCTLQLLGTSTHALAVTPDYAYKLQIGQQQGTNAPDAGTHSYFDSVKVSLSGASLLP